MDIIELVSIVIPSAIGGGLVGQLAQGYISARRLRAENKKMDAEADKTAAETTETLVKASKISNEALLEIVNQLRCDYAALKAEFVASENRNKEIITALSTRVAELEKENAELRKVLNERRRW